MNTPHTSTPRPNPLPVPSALENEELRPATTELMNNPIVTKALALMTSDFATKRRKVPSGWPEEPPKFISHLLDVGMKLAAWGYDEETVAAGLLHDAIEDLPNLWSKERIATEFTPRIAELVDVVSQQNKNLPWEERNEAYAARLHGAPREAVAISMADKISNISSTLPILKAGYPLTSILKRGWQQNSEKFHELGTLFDAVLPEVHVREYRELLSVFDSLGEPLEAK